MAQGALLDKSDGSVFSWNGTDNTLAEVGSVNTGGGGSTVTIEDGALRLKDNSTTTGISIIKGMNAPTGLVDDYVIQFDLMYVSDGTGVQTSYVLSIEDRTTNSPSALSSRLRFRGNAFHHDGGWNGGLLQHSGGTAFSPEIQIRGNEWYRYIWERENGDEAYLTIQRMATEEIIVDRIVMPYLITTREFNRLLITTGALSSDLAGTGEFHLNNIKVGLLVPEPNTAVLLGLGSLVMLRRWRRA